MQAGLEVFQAMRRRGVHQTSTRVGGDVIAQDHRHLTRVERVLQLQQLQRPALGLAQYLARFNAIAFHRRLGQVLGQDQLALGVSSN